jgi:hypothetical protein
MCASPFGSSAMPVDGHLQEILPRCCQLLPPAPMRAFLEAARLGGFGGLWIAAGPLFHLQAGRGVTTLRSPGGDARSG